ncbi:hypothetical protein JH06_1525 [Blastocystis sp. subtype 4]|uniref:hypothetical protein n=1 Tax=Blastocystis sp. subtype 4 TaxID=944170 RepID=UPI0007120731|nr:hypothetical protein JH06_1525 [Blastocystis sp. subtype 4]KNB44621.1 hypothetical protein JH06_1525 [Blastocystis sp. subtype 4]|eukprot:XP_014528064.1 hypothetical protein JH06_1525 [Blastocystis sp. subtype 4]
MLLELRRRQHAYDILEDKYKQYIPQDVWNAKQMEFKNCILANARFLANVVKTHNYYTEMFGIPTQPRDYLSAPYQMSKVKSTLHQLIRDWSDEGKEERELCYTPLLKRLEHYIPLVRNEDGSISPENQRRVLVPGTGLSRLLLEVVERGYAGQGNEFSYQMLLVSNYMLNHVSEAYSIPIYPWTDNPNNVFATGDNNRCILIPDVVPRVCVHEGADFSMCAGEFLESYSDQENAWDCVLTCFFIDTAPVIIEYITVIHKILKPGGYWINLGPLLYHWQSTEDITAEEMDERYGQSLELSFEEIQDIMKKVGFRILEVERFCSPYTDNIRSMMTTLFRGVLFVAQK